VGAVEMLRKSRRSVASGLVNLVVQHFVVLRYWKVQQHLKNWATIGM